MNKNITASEIAHSKLREICEVRKKNGEPLHSLTGVISDLIIKAHKKEVENKR